MFKYKLIYKYYMYKTNTDSSTICNIKMHFSKISALKIYILSSQIAKDDSEQSLNLVTILLSSKIIIFKREILHT